MKRKLSATTAIQKHNHQYHIDCAKGDLAKFILLVGDPQRVDKVEPFLDTVRFRKEHREYRVITGFYQNVEVSILATGIGHDNTEIAIVETSQLVKNPTYIRAGSCGGLQKNIHIGDMVISSGAVRIENTSSFYVCDGYPALADIEVTQALIASAFKHKARYHFGLTASASGFYGAQSRQIKGFHLRNPNFVHELRKTNVLNMEMESSTLFVLSQLINSRAGTICAVFANRFKDEFGEEKDRLKAEKDCIVISLDAFVVLNEMDRLKKKGKSNHYVSPELLNVIK